MFFNSIPFVIFFSIVLVILFCGGHLQSRLAVRNSILLIASYFFYGYFNVGFTFILAFVTIVNYVAGYYMIKRQRTEKIVVAVATILSLLPLIFYKYALFLCGSVGQILSIEFNVEVLNGLVLPVGISFFTFQALSYTIDVYRGKITTQANLLDFALFVSFFPTILSGPIEKARNLLPQIQRYFLPTADNIVQGVCIFTWGLFKKIAIADRLAYFVDWAYSSPDYVSGSTLAVAAIFYSIQIYCDFSGYSDMALGVAKALGFNITKNFKQPYLSSTFKEFWHKWHIALTTWFTEYVYFSLGGSRVSSKLRWVFNVSTIFLLSGIWHGAAWNFVIWGALHAFYYLCEHFIGLHKKELRLGVISSIFSGIIVFILVTLAWIFFRVETFSDAIHIISKIVCDHGGIFSMGASSFTFLGTMLMLAVFCVYEICIKIGILKFDVEEYKHILTFNLFAIIPMIVLMGLFGMSSESFVYFQF